MTGMFCMVLLDIEESVEATVSLLGVPFRLGRGVAGRVSYLLGDARPGTEEVRGGRSGVSISLLGWRCILGRSLCVRCGTSSPGCPSALPVLPALLPFVPVPSLPALCLNLACFLFKPWSRLMMMSLIRGRKLSRLDCEASWLSVSSSIALNSSGTFPRSDVSTPMALNARQAMLNS